MIRLATLSLLLLGMGAAAARDRTGRVEGRLFVSPVGEPFRSDRAGDPEAAWFAGADTDRDGRLSLAEFQADAARWFAVADRGHDGEIDPDDIDWYENELVPEIRVADAPRGSKRSSGDTEGGRGRGGRSGGRGGGMGGGDFSGGHHGGRGGGGQGGSGQSSDAGHTPATTAATAARQGAARYGYLDLPEPLTAADTNLNRGIDRAEMTRAAAERFALLDKNGDGYVDKRELPRVDTRSSGLGPHAPPPGPAPRPDPDRQLGGGDRDQD